MGRRERERERWETDGSVMDRESWELRSSASQQPRPDTFPRKALKPLKCSLQTQMDSDMVYLSICFFFSSLVDSASMNRQTPLLLLFKEKIINEQQHAVL